MPEAIEALQQRAKQAAKASSGGGVDVAGLASRGEALDGARVVIQSVEIGDVKALVDAADKIKGQLGERRGRARHDVDERVHLVAAVTPGLVSRGVKAGDVVKVAAGVVGGGGGGRDTIAQAGGREPAKLPEALDAARAAIASALGVAKWRGSSRSTTAARAAAAR